LTAALLTVLAAGGPGAAPPAGAAVRVAAVPAATAVTACTVTDARATGLSGLVVTKDGYVAVSDSNYDKSRIRIFFLDGQCRLVRSAGYPTSAYDPEDLAVGRDGTLYVADIGDNGRSRRTIAVWRLAPGSSRPQIVRYAYPDGAHDAEALLLAGDDTPIFVTKDPFRTGIYAPTGPAVPSGEPVALAEVGTFSPDTTGTPNGIGLAGELLVTGGTNNAARTKVALRTYSDAYEWTVPDGDVVKAITTGTPRVTPLPDEPQGESIAYTLDGSQLVTVSDQESDPVRTPLLRYPAATGAEPPSPTTSARAAPAPTAAAANTTTNSRWLLPMGAAGVALLGLGIAGIAWNRRRAR
jgi:hypothetical protein